MGGVGQIRKKWQQPSLGPRFWLPGHKAETARADPFAPLITKEVRGVGKEVCDETARADPKGQTR
jgi:hypothetical protein